ncbi:hypothetical protein AAT19DRAFT_14516 [Rhodotorula toruloides]|uniref:Uncharacterized protein n=1 Tax=Rhodotorula toruloides TaxID=5286 RepID=A0A2T0A831_RHOTO|nr:hypothetical protein AAT19DRAFT_14516 [Rhodotorula toruloides]
MFPLFLPFSPLRSSFRLRPSLERSRRMASHSHFRPSFLLVPIKPSMRAASYFSGIEAWRRNTINYLDQQCAYLAATGHQGGIHLQALNTTLTECGSLVRDEIIVSTGGLPTAEQLWDVVSNNRVYVDDPALQHWRPQLQLSDYIVPGNIFPHFPGQHSLLKPEIGRRVARMHGTTKARWEREARAF